LALVLGGLAFSLLRIMAGPFDSKEFNNGIPVDKKLNPQWVKSLFNVLNQLCIWGKN
jgi:hypothetical protein